MIKLVQILDIAVSNTRNLFDNQDASDTVVTEAPRVNLKLFLKIFEKETFGEKAIKAIKEECQETVVGERK